jgi:serine/threonine protein kinase
MLQPGDILASRYRIVSELGKGGMAEVYKVWDSEMNTHLALKLLRDDLAEDKIFLRRFKREAKNLSELQHPNIVRFYGFKIEDGNAFMLLDFIDGITLRKMIYELDGPMPMEEIVKLLRPICSALQFAHNKGLVHNDVKPANIMIHQNGSVLLTDFGIARMIEGTTMTLAGAGTPAYMAPEQCRGMDATPQTDIYALGIILFELITGGERPFTGERAKTTGTVGEKVRWEQVNSRPLSVRKYNKSVSPAIEKIIKKCLAKEPGDRYQSTIDLLTDLTTKSFPPIIDDEKIPRLESSSQNSLTKKLNHIQDAVSEEIEQIAEHAVSAINNDNATQSPPNLPEQKTEQEIVKNILNSNWLCKNCKGENSPNSYICSKCGSERFENSFNEIWNCTKCGIDNLISNQFCANCGFEKMNYDNSDRRWIYICLIAFIIVIGFILFSNSFSTQIGNNQNTQYVATQENTVPSKPIMTNTISPSTKATSAAMTQIAVENMNMENNIQNCDVVGKLPIKTDWPVKYCNMFNNNLDWVTGNLDDEWSTQKSIIQGSNLVFDLNSKRDFIFHSEIYSYPNSQFILSMNAYNEGIGDVSSGIVLYTSDSSYTLFSIIQEYQQFSIFSYDAISNKWFPYIDFVRSSAIKPTGYNRLTIAQINGKIDFYINNRQVHRWNNSPFTSATFGFGVGMYKPGTQVNFNIDDIIVLTP